MTGPNRQRNVLESTDQTPEEQTSRVLRNRIPINRDEARLYFTRLKLKADRVIKVLDALGQGFKIDTSQSSPQLQAIIRHLDPPSGGKYISWGTYRKATDRTHAACFPDLVSFERSRSSDPLANSEMLRTLFLEQAMHVTKPEPAPSPEASLECCREKSLESPCG